MMDVCYRRIASSDNTCRHDVDTQGNCVIPQDVVTYDDLMAMQDEAIYNAAIEDGSTEADAEALINR